MAIDAAVLTAAELRPLSTISPRVLRALLVRCGPHAACYGADIAAFLGGDAGRFVVALGACLCLRAFPQTARLDSPTESCEVLLAAIAAAVKHHCAPAFVAATMAQLAVLESSLDAVEARMRGAHPQVSAAQFAAFIGSPLPPAATADGDPLRHGAATAYLAAADAPSPVQSDDRGASALDRATPGRHTTRGDDASTAASPTPPGGSSKAARRRARRRALEQNTRTGQLQRESQPALGDSTATEGAAVFDGSITDAPEYDVRVVRPGQQHPSVPSVLLQMVNADDASYYPPTHPGFQRGVVPQSPYTTMFHVAAGGWN